METAVETGVETVVETGARAGTGTEEVGDLFW